ncbi:dihydrofolate reductase family protein [Amycolatopsis sp. OK19-0408]|uniref:Dihydrofolate reductase family protein n=1 Tax=Amycolatopsis iheyensis TaxID=2945988 RepID=A0A9X2SMD0_9PSEU|nr:dihydrofolate reductase family protein [Amycolatopsis iheyensis]MCR6487479.1 dihydrofolate reductase family protein [Amycolatopsis iheyensis]
MGKIIVSANVTLDGVVQDPTGDEGTGRGSWFTRIADTDREAWAKAEFEEALGAEVLLMGRRTYGYFRSRGWPSRPGEWADRLRALPKYVVSSSAVEGWGETTVLGGDVVTAVKELKEGVAGEIVVYGSGRLVHTLLEHDLADELRLMTYPFVAGAGARLFPATDVVKPARLVANRTVGAGLALLTYRC